MELVEVSSVVGQCYNIVMQNLSNATKLIAKIVDGKNLTATESEKVFKDVFLYDTAGFHLTALIAAIHAKGETEEELLGFVRAHEKLGNYIKVDIPIDQITDLAGSGGGAFKSFNISTTASFVVAGAGYTVVKEAFFAVTSPTGSADVFAELGMNVFEISASDIKHTLETVGICCGYYPAISPRLKNRGVLNKKILMEHKLQIRTPYHIASNVLSPVKMNRRIYGCYDEKYLPILAKLFAKLKFKHTLVFTGLDGFPEISTVGKTKVIEQKGNTFKEFTLVPSDLGLKKAQLKDIQTGGREQNMIDFLRIIHGIEKGSKRDIVLANASVSFYVMRKVKDFKEGTALARKIIESGKAKEKLENLVNEIGDKKKYHNWLKRAGLG